ncbi:hypothetical protein [Desulfosporosinus sp. SB140]|uniref:hypothetical protein n=1 Tax=Desulfosporosinus paludis TaxID=3115649 RepID=UPI00388E7F8E
MDQKALSIIESHCGQSFRTKQVTEQIELARNIGKLNHNPIVRINEVKARATEWAQSDVFGASGWANIHPDSITRIDDQFEVPGGVLNSCWTEAKVTYTVGYEKLPEPIQKACKLLTENLQHKNINSYKISALLTEEIIDLITPYMRK